jgi:hypothetical protein
VTRSGGWVLSKQGSFDSLVSGGLDPQSSFLQAQTKEVRRSRSRLRIPWAVGKSLYRYALRISMVLGTDLQERSLRICLILSSLTV